MFDDKLLMIISNYWIRFIIIWRRKVTSSYYGSTISRSQQSFLIGGGHLHYRAMEERYGLTFCSRVQQCTGKSHMPIFLCQICRTADCWDRQGILLPRSKRVVSDKVDYTLCKAVLFIPKGLGKGVFFILFFLNMLTNPIRIFVTLHFSSVVLKKV